MAHETAPRRRTLPLGSGAALVDEWFFDDATAGGHALTATGITSATSTGTPALAGTHVLSANGISAAATVGSPGLAGSHVLSASGVAATSGAGSPSVGQSHDLAASGVTSATTVGNPAAAQVNVLVATVVVSASAVGNPALGQSHDLTAAGVSATPDSGTPQLGQAHAISAFGVAAPSSVDAPALSVPVVYSRPERIGGYWVKVSDDGDKPSHRLSARGAVARPQVGRPAAAAVVRLSAQPATSAVNVGTPTLRRNDDREVMLLLAMTEPDQIVSAAYLMAA